MFSQLFSPQTIFSCTNYLITKGAAVDGSTMITYAADSHELYGELYFTPAADHLPGTLLDIYEWDTGKFLGRIKQVAHTYAVVGNMNEHQVSIGETTWGGREELKDPKAIMDYGSLMYIALQRAKTAREAIKVIADLVAEYGYYSSGESFSIADPNEVWIMEIISKGPNNKGAVWVARKVPDGYICAHANQARIRQFPLNDKENCLYSPDVISFAREKGYFTGEDKDFSFADAYAPLDYSALRFCEARVWSMFRRAAPSLNLSIDYVKGVKGAEPLPLWIKPDKKLSVHDVMELMRDHFEGTEFDMTKDVGAGPFQLPYRWRPLTWKVDTVTYCNERAVSTQQTGFSFVAQARSWLPDPIGGVLWFGVDDTYSTVYVPMYCGIKQVPHSFAVGTGSFDEFSWESAFWVFNFVANYAYSRYSDMIKDIQKVQRELEGKFFADQSEIEAAALALYKQSPQLARDYLTEYSVKQGDATVQRWKKLGEFLLYKYLDGNVKNELGKVTHPGYPESWYRRIVNETGEHFKMKSLQ
ncbi:MAG: C69 family dipeptidase [candidate division KSB1 bacterium]|nr:C69 family dipeptidase [candidate division KSB1 bacterium]MDZ7336355.1 C69 family dipeptidase [candidate division KSB1 bacterium]MDZ7356665.1 C69 family dipeptidase [candidate division KSB1 bacterium]MDZ7398542.1 C69 family dipeptidase [candidate division KSB1 bacterium]